MTMVVAVKLPYDDKTFITLLGFFLTSFGLCPVHNFLEI